MQQAREELLPGTFILSFLLTWSMYDLFALEDRCRGRDSQKWWKVTNYTRLDQRQHNNVI